MSYQTIYNSILLTLSFLSHIINSQTGEGCHNRHIPCAESGQLRINAIYHPQTGAFIGGCNCGCDFQSIYNPSSPLYCVSPRSINFDPLTSSGDCSCQCPSTGPQPIDCAHPRIFNHLTCQCECPNQAISSINCPFNQIYNHNTCQCECPDLGAVGFECLNQYFETIPNSKILSDCSCQCPVHSASQSDCESMGRAYNLCQCQCPVQECTNPKQVLNTDTCSCSCPNCPPGEILLNELSCECRRVETPIQSGPTNGIVQYCCHSIIDGFTPFYGRCWGRTTALACASEEYGRCKWNIHNCFHSKPQCSFRDYMCTQDVQCCSNVCKSDGLCR